MCLCYFGLSTGIDSNRDKTLQSLMGTTESTHPAALRPVFTAFIEVFGINTIPT